MLIRRYPTWLLIAALLSLPSVSRAQCAAGELAVTADRDNTLLDDGSGTLSNGAGSYLFAGNTNGSGLRRALVHFDVTGSTPAGSTITAASLHLNMSMTRTGPQDVSLHRVLTDWGEGTSDAGGNEGMGAPATANDATWFHTFFATSFWGNPGGDFSPMASATASVDGNGVYAWGSNPTMVADAQSWLDDPVNNFGWAILGNETAFLTAKRFDSRENAASVSPPTLCLALSAPGLEIPTLGGFGMAVLVFGLAALALYRMRRR